MFLIVDEEVEGVMESSGSLSSSDFGDGINNISILLLFLLFGELLDLLKKCGDEYFVRYCSRGKGADSTEPTEFADENEFTRWAY